VSAGPETAASDPQMEMRRACVPACSLKGATAALIGDCNVKDGRRSTSRKRVSRWARRGAARRSRAEVTTPCGIVAGRADMAATALAKAEEVHHRVDHLAKEKLPTFPRTANVANCGNLCGANDESIQV